MRHAHNIVSPGLLRWLLVWKDKPATKNEKLTREQVNHREFMLNVILSFDEMQKSDPMIVFDERP